MSCFCPEFNKYAYSILRLQLHAPVLLELSNLLVGGLQCSRVFQVWVIGQAHSMSWPYQDFTGQQTHLCHLLYSNIGRFRRSTSKLTFHQRVGYFFCHPWFLPALVHLTWSKERRSDVKSFLRIQKRRKFWKFYLEIRSWDCSYMKEQKPLYWVLR